MVNSSCVCCMRTWSWSAKRGREPTCTLDRSLLHDQVCGAGKFLPAILRCPTSSMRRCFTVLLLLLLLLSGSLAMQGGHVARSNNLPEASAAGLFTMAISSQLNETLVLNASFCSLGQFVYPAPPFIIVSYSAPYAIFSTGWAVQPSSNSSLSCSVIYVGQDTGYSIRFAFEATMSSLSSCWAVWQANGADIDYPIASSWQQYQVGPKMAGGGNMIVLIYDIQWGTPVPQGVTCPGN